MIKRFISVCIVAIIVFNIYGYAKTTEGTLVTEPKTVESEYTDAGSAKSAISAEEYSQSEEEMIPLELVDNQDKTDMVSLLDILREIEEYKSRFIELYTSNASEDTEAEMIIEKHDFPSDNDGGASLTVYSRLSGKHLRYELHYYGETGNSVINYYLCDNFVWISRQNNYYSSLTLSAEYSDVLYSTMENWIITDDAAYIMHDNEELKEMDRTQLESDIPMPDEIAVVEKEQRQIEKFYRTAEEDCGLSHEEAQRWFDIVKEDDILDGGAGEIRDLLFDDIDGNGMTDMIIMVQETEMKYMYGTGAIYFYMNEEEPYCFTDEEVPFFYWNICYADLNRDGNVEIAIALMGTGNGGTGDWHKVLFSYTGSTMERMEFPSDFDYDDDEYEVGLHVDVIMEPEPDTYTAYCPYLDESIPFQARNTYEGESQLAYLEEAPKDVGGNLRGYYDLQIVTWKGRDALQVGEYLCGEGGNAHRVGYAYFILIWDEQGNGSVADWWVEGNTENTGGLIFYSYK